jgi:hypothetical protein
MLLTRKLNTYMSLLVITIFASGAALIIEHVANANTYSIFQYENTQTASLGL